MPGSTPSRQLRANTVPWRSRRTQPADVDASGFETRRTSRAQRSYVRRDVGWRWGRAYGDVGQGGASARRSAVAAHRPDSIEPTRPRITGQNGTLKMTPREFVQSARQQIDSLLVTKVLDTVNKCS